MNLTALWRSAEQSLYHQLRRILMITILWSLVLKFMFNPLWQPDSGAASTQAQSRAIMQLLKFSKSFNQVLNSTELIN
jgi:hypothetical protein